MKEIKINKLYWCEFKNDFGHTVDKVVKVRKKMWFLGDIYLCQDKDKCLKLKSNQIKREVIL